MPDNPIEVRRSPSEPTLTHLTYWRSSPYSQVSCIHRSSPRTDTRKPTIITENELL